MPARAIRDADAYNSFLDKQCSSVINCCSFGVCFPAIRQRLPSGDVKQITAPRTSLRGAHSAHTARPQLAHGW